MLEAGEHMALVMWFRGFIFSLYLLLSLGTYQPHIWNHLDIFSGRAGELG